MTGGELQIIAMFVACAIAIPIVVVGWMRDPMGRAVERQRKADESEARRAAAPHRPHVSAAPIGCPVKVRFDEDVERLVDVINGGTAR